MGETDKSVVEIEIADHHAIGEHREIRARFDAADQDCRGLFCTDAACELECNLAWRRGITTERASDSVQDGTLGESDDVFGKILVSQPGRIAGEPLRERNFLRDRAMGPRPHRQAYCSGLA